jgi:hypothetical protein
VASILFEVSYIHIAYNNYIGTVVPLLRATYGQGTGTIVEHIRCSGTESQLTDCNIRDVADGECTHSDDASVQCSELIINVYTTMIKFKGRS